MITTYTSALHSDSWRLSSQVANQMPCSICTATRMKQSAIEQLHWARCMYSGVRTNVVCAMRWIITWVVLWLYWSGPLFVVWRSSSPHLPNILLLEHCSVARLAQVCYLPVDILATSEPKLRLIISSKCGIAAGVGAFLDWVWWPILSYDWSCRSFGREPSTHACIIVSLDYIHEMLCWRSHAGYLSLHGLSELRACYVVALWPLFRCWRAWCSVYVVAFTSRERYLNT